MGRSRGMCLVSTLAGHPITHPLLSDVVHVCLRWSAEVSTVCTSACSTSITPGNSKPATPPARNRGASRIANTQDEAGEGSVHAACLNDWGIPAATDGDCA